MLNNWNKKYKVMLVDDNEVDLQVNSRIISISRISDDIIKCSSGEEALIYLRKHQSEPDSLPKLILLDIQMPEMDGFEFLEHFRSLPENVKTNCLIAILSSTLDFGDIKRSEANPLVTKLIRKPLYPKELEEILKQYYIINT